MSASATVPVFAPDGTLGDVPYEQLKAALKAGAKPGVTIKAPDGSLGVVPADRYRDAAKAGATIVPFHEQETQHPGFWATAAEDLKGLLHPSGFSPYPGMDQEAKSAAATEHALEDQSRKAAGYSLPYRVGAPIAQAVGANVPGMEKSAAEGDVAGVLGHTAAPIATVTAGEALAHTAKFTPELADAIGERVQAGLQRPVAKFAGQVVDLASFHRISKLYDAYKGMREAIGPKPTYPGAPLPELPAPELLQARSLEQGAHTPVPEPAAALGSIPQPRTLNALSGDAPVPAPVAAPAESLPTPASVENTPKTLNGESVLNQVLGGRDNATLLKVARSRGINVTKEAQLKAGVANKAIIGKIIDDFSPEELQEIRDQAIENNRFRHAFGDIGEEAWNTMALQTYFPDIKIPASQLIRTKTAITNAPLKNAVPETGALGDLAAQIKKTAKATKAKPAATAPATDLEDQVAEMSKQVKAGKTLRDLSAQ